VIKYTLPTFILIGVSKFPRYIPRRDIVLGEIHWILHRPLLKAQNTVHKFSRYFSANLQTTWV